LAVQELPDDDRNRFYLGRELMFNGRHDEAAVHLRRHLELSKWAPERATCMRYLGRITGDKEPWFLRACAEAPHRREPWVELAQYYHDVKQWDQAYAVACRALSIREKPLEYLCEEDAWGSLPHDLASVSAWYLGLRDAAIKHGLDATELNVHDERLKNNVLLMQTEMADPPGDT
jgi:tetratricopeptide (TPR) repeat protein